MKNKNMIFEIFILIFILICIWLLISPAALANMNYSCTKPKTSISTVSFSAEKGERIKWSFTSEIVSGELDLILYDSVGNTVYELDRAKEPETFCTLEESDTYILAAEYSDFVGMFNMEVYKAESAK